MLRLRPFELLFPRTVEEAVALLLAHQPGARLLAGGTDLLPALKLQHQDAEVVVSLRDVGGLQEIAAEGGELCIGARARLADVAANPQVRETLPALADAVGRIAAPQLRWMGTLAGNLCQDVRCRYINQSSLWREALGGCLKSDGDVCHVVPGGRRCVAALSADSVPVLVAADARVDVLGPAGARAMAVGDLYGPDGTAHLRLDPAEVITRIRVPIPDPLTRIRHRKWAMRRSIDYPLVSVAVRLDRAAAAEATLAGGCIVAVALGTRPKRLDLAKFAGAPLDGLLAARLGAYAEERLRPLPNIPYDAEYRRMRVGVEVERAALELLEEGR